VSGFEVGRWGLQSSNKEKLKVTIQGGEGSLAILGEEKKWKKCVDETILTCPKREHTQPIWPYLAQLRRWKGDNCTKEKKGVLRIKKKNTLAIWTEKAVRAVAWRKKSSLKK